MDKLVKPLFLSALLFGLFACESDDVDGVTPGEFNYIIVNGTEHRVLITTDPLSASEKTDSVLLSFQDSMISYGYFRHWGDLEPFPSGGVFVTFDDTVTYKCGSGEGYETNMFGSQYNYECLLNGPDLYKYRYVITEEDYEYAKAHPYKGE